MTAASRRTLQAGLSALLVAGVVACGTPAWGAAGSELAAQTSTTVVAGTTTTDVTWSLPEGALPGDTVTLALPDHAGGVLTDGRWLSASGALIGQATLDADGTLSILLAEAAADPANRAGETLVSTVDTASPGETVTAEFAPKGTLPAGEVPGEFHGAVDRTEASKYGAWVPGAPRIQWTIETPRGPWDLVTVADPAPAGSRVDCTAGVGVRSTTRTAPDTGYLIDLVPVSAERVSTTCDASGVTVTVTPVERDEMLEVRFFADVATATADAANTATVSALRTPEPVLERTTELRTVPVEQPTPTPTPTPTPSEPTPSEPTPTPTESTPPRLPATGGDETAAATAALAGTLALIAGAIALGVARRRGGARA